MRSSVHPIEPYKTDRVAPTNPRRMPLTPYAGPFGRPELIHLLRRTLFGVSPADLAHFNGMTLQQVVDELSLIHISWVRGSMCPCEHDPKRTALR